MAKALESVTVLGRPAADGWQDSALRLACSFEAASQRLVVLNKARQAACLVVEDPSRPGALLSLDHLFVLGRSHSLSSVDFQHLLAACLGTPNDPNQQPHLAYRT